MSIDALTFTTLALGVSANVDNLPVGFAYGCRGVLIDGPQNVAIAAITTAATAAAMAFGEHVGRIASPTVAHVAGGAALVLLGAWNLAGDVRDKGRQDALLPSAQGRVSWREVLVLAASLSINNLGVGAAAGIGGIGLAELAAVVFPTSIVFLALGWALGRGLTHHVLSLLPRAALVGDTLLLLVGVAMALGA